MGRPRRQLDGRLDTFADPRRGQILGQAVKFDLVKRLKAPWMSEREYHANVEGLNIVFGATLGFVLASAENLTTRGFLIVLGLTVGIVVTILYIRASEKRMFYTLLAFTGIAGLPSVLGTMLQDGDVIPLKLQPALAAWAVVMALVEFSPRAKAPATAPSSAGDGLSPT